MCPKRFSDYGKYVSGQRSSISFQRDEAGGYEVLVELQSSMMIISVLLKPSFHW